MHICCYDSCKCIVVAAAVVSDVSDVFGKCLMVYRSRVCLLLSLLCSSHCHKTLNANNITKAAFNMQPTTMVITAQYAFMPHVHYLLIVDKLLGVVALVLIMPVATKENYIKCVHLCAVIVCECEPGRTSGSRYSRNLINWESDIELS